MDLVPCFATRFVCYALGTCSIGVESWCVCSVGRDVLGSSGFCGKEFGGIVLRTL